MSYLNKRECRKVADPQLKFNGNNAMLYTEQINYILRTAVKNIGGKRILILYVFDREKIFLPVSSPKMTIFQGKDDYMTLCWKENQETVWSEACFENLMIKTGRKKVAAFYTHGDEKRIQQYCGLYESSGTSALEQYQQKIMEKRRKRNAIVREKRIQAVMSTLPKLSRKQRSWLEKELLPYYIFYDYSRKGPENAYCTACMSKVDVGTAKHNQAGICPKCKRTITFKSRNRSKRLWERGTGQIIQRTSNGQVAIRIFKVEQWWPRGERDFFLRESARYFLDFEDGSCSEESYYNSYSGGYITSWKRGMRPQFSYWQYNFEGNPSGVLYTENLSEELADTPWEYCQIGRYGEKEEDFAALFYLRVFYEYPAIEYLVKMGLHRLVRQVVEGRYQPYVVFPPHVNFKKKSPTDILGIPKQYFPVLQDIDAGDTEVGILQSLASAGVTKDVREAAFWCKNSGVTDAKSITVPLRYMTAHRWMKYIEKQVSKRPDPRYRVNGYNSLFATTALDYKDYLIMCADCRVDLTNDFNLFPKDLRQRHDDLVKIAKTEEVKKMNRAIGKQFAGLKKRYGWQANGLIIVPPKSADAIVQEAEKLLHCAGRYASAMAKGETTILFIRKESDPQKPYYTMEVSHEKIVQIRGYDNSDPPKEINMFISEWEQRILNPMIRIHQNSELVEDKVAA